MKIVTSLTEFPAAKPVALTIGTFDGFHKGHQAVIARTIEDARKLGGEAWALTYSNHPASILRPFDEKPLLTSLKHKLALLERSGLDGVILLEFTLPFSKLSPEEFLKTLLETLPLKALILGHDARLGSNRSGDEERLKAFASKHNFTLDYLEPVTHQNFPISSTKIRELVERGKLEKVKEILGRPFSLLLPVQPGQGLGEKIGFHTANFPTKGYCLPPLGVWAASLKVDGKSYPAVVNLGYAPTVRDDLTPVLEVHAIGETLDLKGKWAEVTFYKYLRTEQKFSGIETLKAQIQKDVDNAIALFSEQNFE